MKNSEIVMENTMIRKFIDNDLDSVMEIWLSANINAHNFISKDYWLANFETVKGMLPSYD